MTRTSGFLFQLFAGVSAVVFVFVWIWALTTSGCASDGWLTGIQVRSHCETFCEDAEMVLVEIRASQPLSDDRWQNTTCVCAEVDRE
jgi:hypothetical protein